MITVSSEYVSLKFLCAEALRQAVPPTNLRDDTRANLYLWLTNSDPGGESKKTNPISLLMLLEWILTAFEKDLMVRCHPDQY